MNVELVSIVWACLQIGGLCTVSLSIAWLLRGRRPQLVSAMLAGTCLATLLLALVALVPHCQWTFVTAELGKTNTTTQDANPTTWSPADPASGGDAPAAHSEQSTASNRANSTNSADSIATEHNAGSQPGSLITFQSLRNLLSRALERVDLEVRLAEEWQQPLAAARNYGIGFFLLVGLSAMSLLWCSSWLYVRRVLKSSQPLDDTNILSLVASHARAFGLRRTPVVRESHQVPIGATVGWYRVTVLLHADWRDWTDQEKSAVIAHELAHAARHDFAWVVIASWTRILLFFHPLVHLLIHRWRMEQELAADQLAAGKVGNAKAYGRALASLALRNQLSLGTSNSHMGSMLAAGQICVTRRVLMLKQGSLQPVQSRSRWSLAIVIAIACSAGPIAGLRGTAQEPSRAAVAATATPPTQVNTATEAANGAESVATTGPTSEEGDEAAIPTTFKPLSKEFLEAYPPLVFKGSLVYRPGRLRAGEFGAEVAWVQELLTVAMLGRPMPDDAVVHGDCPFTLRWRDEARQHGSVDIAASFREGESTIAGQLGNLSRFHGMFRSMRAVTNQQYGGRTISGVTYSATDDQPEQWLVDDDAGYFLGSLEDAKKFIQGQRFAVDAIPESFRDDYLNSAFAIVFTDCEQWHAKIATYTMGSTKEATFQVVMQLIKDAKQIGLFVDGCQSPACTIRAEMLDESAAKRLADQSKALVEMAKLAILSTPPTNDESAMEFELVRSFWETLSITTHRTEVHFQFDVFAPSMDNGSIFAEFSSIVGWQNINGSLTLHESDIPYVEITPIGSAPTFPSLFSQTLDARNYRGKTVSMEMELQCHEESLGETGVFAWASRHEAVDPEIADGSKPLRSHSPYAGHRMLAARTSACDGVSTFRSSQEPQYREARTPGTQWRKMAVQMVVPDDAEHLSFGCYSERDVIRMRNADLRIITPNNSPSSTTEHSHDALGHDALANMPYNVLIVPGQEIRSEPLNLRLTDEPAESIRQATQPAATLR